MRYQIHRDETSLFKARGPSSDMRWELTYEVETRENVDPLLIHPHSSEVEIGILERSRVVVHIVCEGWVSVRPR